MILLDTCVVSEALRPAPSARVLGWIDTLPEHRVYLPALVVGELQRGIELLPKGGRRSALFLWLEQLRERFRDRILPMDEETSVIWGSLVGRLEQNGRKVPVVDGLLAATALRHSAILATRNVADFRDTGVEVINPWEDTGPGL